MGKWKTAQDHYDEAGSLLRAADQVLFGATTPYDDGNEAYALAVAKMAEVHVMLGDRAAQSETRGRRGCGDDE